MLESTERSDLAFHRSRTVWSAQPLGGSAKRTMDLILALGAIVALLPLLLVICALLKSKEDGPILFKQTRIGFNGRRFSCYKFRSMSANAERELELFLARNPEARIEWETTHKLKDDPRITPLGRFLRKTSLDELPQLFNILLGDMSVVGPRPIVEAEIVRYGSDYDSYIAGRPGLTGLWQVSGRSDCTYPERVALDRSYVEDWSLALDMRIIAKTFRTVLAREGSY